MIVVSFDHFSELRAGAETTKAILPQVKLRKSGKTAKRFEIRHPEVRAQRASKMSGPGSHPSRRAQESALLRMTGMV
jgi:hypothetical protein